MDFTWLVPLLALGTMLAMTVLALVGLWAIKDHRHDPGVPGPTPATDRPQVGIAPVNSDARRVQASVAVGNGQNPMIH